MYTAEELAYMGSEPSDYFSHSGYAQRFHELRRAKQIARKAQGKLPTWTLELEHALVNEVHIHQTGEPWVAPNWNLPSLDVDAIKPAPSKRRPLPAFKLPYTKLEEINLRLGKTLITIKGQPFYVKLIRKRASDFQLALDDALGKSWVVDYKDIPDLRSPPSIYITYSGMAGWMQRHPERVYQQGLNKLNTAIRSVDSDQGIAVFKPEQMVPVLASRVNRSWNSTCDSMMRDGTIMSLRLSDSLACKRDDKRGHIDAFYKGRKLGVIHEDEIKALDEDDCLQDWVVNEVAETGLKLRA